MEYIVKKDYTEESRELVTEAFKDKPVFDHYLRLISEYSNAVQALYKSLGEERWIDTAVGAQLDILGNIVGQDRVLVGGDLVEFFGYLGALNARSYGTLNDPSVGGYYRGKNQPTSGNFVLNDELYRIFIRAKIMKNTTRATPEDVIKFIRFVFQRVASVWITSSEYGEATMEIFSDGLTLTDRGLIAYFLEGKSYTTYLVPKVLGVKYNIEFVNAPTYFGFQGTPNVGPWDDGSGDVGGIWYAKIG